MFIKELIINGDTYHLSIKNTLQFIPRMFLSLPLLWCADYFPTRLTSKSHDGPQPQGNKDKAKVYPQQV